MTIVNTIICYYLINDWTSVSNFIREFIDIIATNDSIAFDNWQGPITLKQAYVMML